MTFGVIRSEVLQMHNGELKETNVTKCLVLQHTWECTIVAREESEVWTYWLANLFKEAREKEEACF